MPRWKEGDSILKYFVEIIPEIVLMIMICTCVFTATKVVHEPDLLAAQIPIALIALACAVVTIRANRVKSDE